MRRVWSVFATIWLIVVVPSLVIWGVMTRWSAAASHRFESIWRWSVDRLGFPLIVAPLTDWSWASMHHGPMWQAVVGFVMVVTVWTTMIALPVTVIVAWSGWLNARLSRRSPQAASAPDGSLALPINISGSHSTGLSTLLYAITIPLAVAYHLGYRVVRALRPAVRAFLITWVIAMIVLIIGVYQVDNWEFPGALLTMSRAWDGYLSLLHVPRIFEGHWQAWWTSDWQQAKMYGQFGDAQLAGWYRIPAMRDLMILFAARHALAVAIIVAVFSIAKQVLGATKENGR